MTNRPAGNLQQEDDEVGVELRTSRVEHIAEEDALSPAPSERKASADREIAQPQPHDHQRDSEKVSHGGSPRLRRGKHAFDIA